ncbi:MAG: 23S rRNA (adenine(2503)-C(2))-methyltransferase RlmN [Ignavibacteria bacterium]|nr:23S rRNA (adenine(2503)-C(2))-methyltransferase RlmN [Ignavibacteria bacterium]
MKLPNLFGLTLAELEAEFVAGGLERYRAAQVYYWLYARHAATFEAMTNLSKPLRAKLAERYVILHPVIAGTQAGGDGTRKYLVALEDGRSVETVLIPAESDEEGLPKRLTLCVSTQVGCPLGCRFCATATMTRRRNLTVGEIVGQYLAVQAVTPHRITNLVYMGMGEPMLNYEATMRSIDIITHEITAGVGAARITISTAGVVEGIKRLADEGRNVKLAVSLHSLVDAVRGDLMPINRKHPVGELVEAVEYYARRTRRRVTFEYILFDGLNDSPEDNARLVKLAGRVHCKVNLIPFHSIDASLPEGETRALRPSPKRRIEQFAQALREAGVTVMLRSSSGKDIAAACGQLAIAGDR